MRTLDDDDLTGLQSLLDDNHQAHSPSYFDRANIDLVIVVDYGNLITALQFSNGALRNEQRAGLDARHRANLPILPWTQNISRVQKNPAEPDCARLLIHLSIGDEELTFMRIG